VIRFSTQSITATPEVSAIVAWFEKQLL